MAAHEPTFPIIRTKLHRPPVAKDLVCRKALHDRLEEGADKPLTLVSAPAGYGKSTLVAHWLETLDGPSAWLSIDASDGDLRTFLGYLVAALQTVVPEACAETLVQLAAAELPPPPVLAGCLGNDLDDLEESLVLVLDDYHRIEEPAAHELLNHLLQHPAGSLQLVLISRYDPPLLLGALRAHDKVTEIRAQDLMFTPTDTAAFLELATGQAISSAALACLHRSTEGWVAGLRLAVLALRHRSDADAFLREFNCDVRAVQDYLVEEVLSQQPPAVVDCLCRTSILGRFCAPLCEALGAPSGEGHGDPLDGLTYIHSLEDAGLFCVALDERGEWYRYHHLFQELLQRQLKDRLGPEEIARLHRRAAAWFEAHGWLEEAIDHTLQADGPAAAGRLIVRHRNDILNGEQWHRLDGWLRRLPAEIIEDDPELLMLKAWHLRNQGLYVEALLILDRVEELVSSEPRGSAATPRLRGSINALRSYKYYISGQADLALKCTEQALIDLSADCLSERAYAFMMMAGALRTNGDLEGARKVINDALADTSLPLGTFQCRMLMALSLISWVAADLPAMRLAAKQYLELGEKLGLAESFMNAHYFLGSVQYHQNELSKAEASLVHVASDRGAPNQQFSTDSVFALTSVYQARGKAEQARATVKSVCERMLNIRNTTLLQRAHAYQADLALRQGRMAEAVNWARGFDPEPFQNNMYLFYEPRMTLARVLIAEGSADSHRQADSLLTRLETFVAGFHNTRFLIEVLALQALLRDARGDEPAALLVFSRAVSLAQPGGFIRLFVDLGAGIPRLLNRLDLDAEGLRYVGRILAAFRGDEQTQAGETPDRCLTKRELEILALLAEELSNNQISDRLCISPATVKRHTENIYQKLDVRDRRKAVAKAMELAIIRSRRGASRSLR